MTILVLLQYSKSKYFTESRCYRSTSEIEILYSAKNHLDTLVARGKTLSSYTAKLVSR